MKFGYKFPASFPTSTPPTQWLGYANVILLGLQIEITGPAAFDGIIYELTFANIFLIITYSFAKELTFRLERTGIEISQRDKK